MNYKRGDIVILPFPFIMKNGIKQKGRPALIISDHDIKRRFNDIILTGITSKVQKKINKTEYLINENSVNFKKSGLIKTSVVRCEYIMTISEEIINRKIGELPKKIMNIIDKKLKISIGLK